MIIDRTHLGWGIATVAATAVVTVVYLANNDPELLPFPLPLPGWLGPVPPLRANVGATPLGLIYGTVALLIFIFAALLGWSRKHPKWRIGSVQSWLKAHIWLAIFTIPLVLLHCGFHGGGPMSQFLLVLYALVMLSGFWGLALQQVVPKLMKNYLPEEVIFEEIPYIRGQLVAQAEELRKKLDERASVPEAEVAMAGGGSHATVRSPQVAEKALIELMDREALPYLRKPSARGFRLIDPRTSDDIFRLLKLQVPPEVHASVEQVQNLCDEKRRLDLQTRLHYWLHGWLLFHAPASILLVVLTVWHAVVAVLVYD